MALNDIGAIVNAGPEDLVAHGGMAERAGFSQVTADVVQIVPHAAELADAVQVGGGVGNHGVSFAFVFSSSFWAFIRLRRIRKQGCSRCSYLPRMDIYGYPFLRGSPMDAGARCHRRNVRHLIV